MPVVWMQHCRDTPLMTASQAQGDGLTMGGLMVIKKGVGGPSYAFAEERFGDHASFDEVLEACQAASQ